MKKKVTAVLLVLTLLLSMAAVAGCGSNSGSDGVTEIEIIQYKMEATDYFDALEDEFNKTHDDIHLTIDSPNDASTIMRTRFIREDYPDIIGIGGDINYSYYVDAEILADLSDWDGMADIKQSYLDIAEGLEIASDRRNLSSRLIWQTQPESFITRICSKNTAGASRPPGMS